VSQAADDPPPCRAVGPGFRFRGRVAAASVLLSVMRTGGRGLGREFARGDLPPMQPRDPPRRPIVGLWEDDVGPPGAVFRVPQVNLFPSLAGSPFYPATAAV